MSEMIDRVAEAIELCRRSLIEKPLARVYEDLAIAAIEAMREPTEAMLIAGIHHENMGDMAGRWNAMIDAALED